LRSQKDTIIPWPSGLKLETTVASDAQSRASVREKVVSELKELAVITACLYVCFAALIRLKAAILHAEGVPYAPLGIAAIKAVICAKFMLMGSAFHLGERSSKPSLISSTLYRSFTFLALLIVLNVIEEAVVGVVHGKSVLDSIADIAGGTWYQIVVTSFILLQFPFSLFALLAMSSATEYLFGCSSRKAERAQKAIVYPERVVTLPVQSSRSTTDKMEIYRVRELSSRNISSSSTRAPRAAQIFRRSLRRNRIGRHRGCKGSQTGAKAAKCRLSRCFA
jgi:hypothetical protein